MITKGGEGVRPSNPLITHDYKSKMAKLQDVRMEKGLSQAQLAAAAEVKVRMLQNYEQGKQADINGAKLSTLLKLCLALNCRLTDILDDPETLDLLEKYESR